MALHATAFLVILERPRVSANVIQTRTKNLGSVCIPGCWSFKFSSGHRASSSVVVGCGGGARSSFSPSVAATGEDRIASGCFGRRGHSDHSHVRQRGIGLSRTAARCSYKGGEALAQHSFALRGHSGMALVSRVVASVIVFGSLRSVAIAPLCG
jgi:hypothetical protein